VFNFDVPTHAEDYIHRIGRTGRAGRSGISITLASGADGKYLDAITRLIQHDIPVMSIDAGRGGGETAPTEQTETPRERPPRENRLRGRGRDRGPKRDNAPRSAPVESAARTAAPSAPKPRPDRPAKQTGRSGDPFGSDGPVPAFLLRPGTAR